MLQIHDILKSLWFCLLKVLQILVPKVFVISFSQNPLCSKAGWMVHFCFCFQIGRTSEMPENRFLWTMWIITEINICGCMSHNFPVSEISSSYIDGPWNMSMEKNLHLGSYGRTREHGKEHIGNKMILNWEL